MHTDRAVFFEAWYSKMQREMRGAALCRTSSLELPKIGDRLQNQETPSSLCSCRHKHFFFFECFMKRVAHVIWKRQECLYLSGMTTFLFNLSDAGIAHGPEAHKEAERSASLRPAGFKAAEIAARWCICTWRTKLFGSNLLISPVAEKSCLSGAAVSWVLVKCWCFEELQNDNFSL